MHREVLARGHRAQVVHIAALNPGNKGHAKLAGEKRILAIGFLAAPPAWIAKDVDVGRPERQSIKNAMVALALRLVVLAAGLGRDDVAHRVHQRGVPRCAHADSLRKDRRVAGARHSVKRLIPRLVVGNAKPRDGCCPVLELVGLLIQGHPSHQVMCPLSRRQTGVLIRRRGLLCQRDWADE